ncbi:MAG: hypothetical protein GWN82_01250 [Gemmatimonadetes bacterium]|nr:hypothetical protein [Actinomycetota bacterium]NIT85565.1 hypothetical protein [Gemmatimonadota bacterium]NIU74320.1 hypothetical protein [Gammaproteobacteria bacterium]NIU29395.1 hypothetical protein [Gemmatimonadota bacterium]NIV59811.1 hypothetical protein [Gemmatimonadota bacterium]
MSLRLVPTTMRRFQVRRAPPEDAEWLKRVLDREGERWGTGAELQPDGTIAVTW